MYKNDARFLYTWAFRCARVGTSYKEVRRLHGKNSVTAAAYRSFLMADDDKAALGPFAVRAGLSAVEVAGDFVGFVKSGPWSRRGGWVHYGPVGQELGTGWLPLVKVWPRRLDLLRRYDTPLYQVVLASWISQTQPLLNMAGFADVFSALVVEYQAVTVADSVRFVDSLRVVHPPCF